MSELRILVAGNPVDGLTFHGPFRDVQEMDAYADNNISDNWWMATLATPDLTVNRALEQVLDIAIAETWMTEESGQLANPTEGDYLADIVTAFARREEG